MEKNGNNLKESPQVKSLVIVFSYHHNNTEKIAERLSHTCLVPR